MNVSGWETYQALHGYPYRSAHARPARDWRQWFEPIGGFTTALWWVPAGERPSSEDGLARLALLNREGPTPRAFSLLRQFDPGGSPVATTRRLPR